MLISILVVVALIWYGFNTFIYPTTEEKESQPPTFTKKQIEFYKGEKRQYVNDNGELVSLDEHETEL